jgi:hypothetical protein
MVTVALALAIAILAAVTHSHYPIHRWLLWTYVALWGLSLAFVGACLSVGHAVLTRVLRLRVALTEHLVLAFATGVLVFALGVFACGVAGLLGGVFFVAYPALLLAATAPALVRDLGPSARRAWRVRLRFAAPAPALWPWIVGAFGMASVVLLYVQVLAPASVVSHGLFRELAVAERHVVAGHIGRFPEGWFEGTLPPLTSWLHTWALACPGTSLFFRVGLAAHVELTLLLATAASVPRLSRWLVGPHRHGGVALFLVPGVFVLGAALGAGRVMGVWAVPVALAARRLLPVADHTTGPRNAILLGLLLAGAVLTQLQGIAWLAGVGVLMGVSAGDRFRARPLSTLRLALLALGVLVVATTPYWLTNWIFHGNPLYPYGQKWWGGEPWSGAVTVGAPATSRDLLASLRAPATWHWGALFVLLGVPALAARGSRRYWALAVATAIATVVAALIANLARVGAPMRPPHVPWPWMAAVMAASMVLLWRSRSMLVRVSLVACVGLHLVWAAGLAFVERNGLPSAYRASLQLASSGHRRREAERQDVGTELVPLGRALPAGATAVVHEDPAPFGLGHPAVVDARGRQGAIAYGEWRTPRAVHDGLRGLGVTHVLWKPDPGFGPSFTDDLVFHEFVRRHADRVDHRAGYEISRLRDQPPHGDGPGAAGDRVAIVSCTGARTVPWSEVDRAAQDLQGLNDAPCAAPGVTPAPPGPGTRFVLVDARLGTADVARAGWELLFTRERVRAYARPP